MGFLIDDMLRSTLVHERVGLQRKEKVEDIDQEENNTSTPGDLQHYVICCVGVGKRGMECCLDKMLVVEVEGEDSTHWQQQADDA